MRLSRIEPCLRFRTDHLIDFRGQPAVRLALPQGDACPVALHGGQVLSWTTADGVERIYLSPRAVFDGRSAIRGGVPDLLAAVQPARPPGQAWRSRATWPGKSKRPKRAGLVLALNDNVQTRAVWPHAFGLRLTVTLVPGQLRMALDVRIREASPGTSPQRCIPICGWTTHRRFGLEGLQGAQRWDAVRDVRHAEAGRGAAVRRASSTASTPRRRQPLRLVQPLRARCEISAERELHRNGGVEPGPCLERPAWPTCPTMAAGTCCAWRPRASTRPCCWQPGAAVAGLAANCTRAADSSFFRKPITMLAKRIIPCLDVTGGRVVKGVNFARTARRRRPGGDRRALQRARRRRADLSGHHRHQRRPRPDPADHRSRGLAGLHPADRGRRRAHRGRRAPAAQRRGRQDQLQLGGHRQPRR